MSVDDDIRESSSFRALTEQAPLLALDGMRAWIRSRQGLYPERDMTQPSDVVRILLDEAVQWSVVEEMMARRRRFDIANREELKVHKPSKPGLSGLLEDDANLNEVVLRCIQAGRSLSVADLTASTGRARTSVKRSLANLVKANTIVRTGNGNNTRYSLP